jgi:sulfite exporter TauE/SafE
MLSLIATLFLGFVLGMRHATDPDHIVAITTIVTKQRGIGKAALIGALWGLGHTLTMFIVGTVIILFRVTIPPRLGLSMEFAVAGMLVLLGILNLTATLQSLQDRLIRFAPRRFACYQLLRPLIIGVVHGLAGSAAVALLVMTTIRDPWWSIGYLLLFGLGTVAGMMLMTTVIAMPLTLASNRFSGFSRRISIASGLFSLGFGLFLTYQTAIVNGLFSDRVHWTPH